MDKKQPQKPPGQKSNAWQKFLRTCTRCKEVIDPDTLICSHCGFRLQTKCPYCGNPLPPAGAQVCGSCGKPIEKA